MTDGPILTPAQVHELIVRPVMAMSVAAQVAQVVQTDASAYRFPVVKSDPVAQWVEEGEEIPPSDAELDEVLVQPAKLAGLSIITRELAEDSSPEAQQAVGNGLARDIARKLDAAFFGSRGGSLVQPAGLGDLPGPMLAAVSGPFTNTDVFASAVGGAELLGSTVGAFVTDPTTALSLALVKKAAGSNEPLLGTDATEPGLRRILGIPLLVSPSVQPDTVWGIPSGQAFLVIRAGTRIEVDRSVFFTSDRVAVKATMRVGFGFPAPVVKVVRTA